MAAAALCVLARRKAKAAYLLAFLVTLIGATILTDFLSDGDEAGSVADLCLHPLMGVLSGPIAYLYARSFTRKGSGRAIMPIPALAAATALLLLYVALALPYLRRFFFMAELASLLGLLGFLAAAIAEYLRCKKAEAASARSLRWLRFFLAFMAMLAAAAAILYFQRRYFDLIWPLASFLALSVSFLAMTRPESLFDAGESEKREKYRKSTLSPEEIRRCRTELDSLVIGKQAYLDSELSLGALAASLSVAPHRLSQAINRSYGMGFHEFLAKQRVSAAMGLLDAPGAADRKILDVCHSSGFGTLSAFNAAFKKETGLTPSEFRKRAADRRSPILASEADGDTLESRRDRKARAKPSF
jgi:AraC-like DNA-binding protein